MTPKEKESLRTLLNIMLSTGTNLLKLLDIYSEMKTRLCGSVSNVVNDERKTLKQVLYALALEVVNPEKIDSDEEFLKYDKQAKELLNTLEAD